MVAIFGNSPLTFVWMAIPMSGYFFGKYIDRCETLRMTRYRDRSALFGRPPPPEGTKEAPSWPDWPRQ